MPGSATTVMPKACVPHDIGQALAWRARPCCLPSCTPRRHPGLRLSRLVAPRALRHDGWPMRAPVNASPRPRGSSTHDSGADADRYSFIAVDLHHLLLAGIPALSCNTRSRAIAPYDVGLPPSSTQANSLILNGRPPFGHSVTVAWMPGGSTPTYSGRKRRSSIERASVFSTWLIAPPMQLRLPPPKGM